MSFLFSIYENVNYLGRKTDYKNNHKNVGKLDF